MVLGTPTSPRTPAPSPSRVGSVDAELALATCCALVAVPRPIGLDALLRRARAAFRLDHAALAEGRHADTAAWAAAGRQRRLSVLPGSPSAPPLEVAWSGPPSRPPAFVHALRRLGVLAGLAAGSTGHAHRLQSALDLLAHPALIVSADGRVVRLNEACRRADADAGAGGTWRPGDDYLDAWRGMDPSGAPAIAASLTQLCADGEGSRRHHGARGQSPGLPPARVDLIALPGRGTGVLALHRGPIGPRGTGREAAAVERACAAAREGERRRIAQELHDDIVQRLVLVAIGLDDVTAAEGAAAAALDRHRTSLRAIAADLRALSHRLAPPTLKRDGLAFALGELARALGTAHGLPVAVSADPAPAVTAEAALTLYRIAQEALMNAAKHSGASRVRLSLRVVGGTLRLTITDDGRGFQVRAGHPGLGIGGMRERMARIGGTLAISSGPLGTQVRATCPSDGGRHGA